VLPQLANIVMDAAQVREGTRVEDEGRGDNVRRGERGHLVPAGPPWPAAFLSALTPENQTPPTLNLNPPMQTAYDHFYARYTGQSWELRSLDDATGAGGALVRTKGDPLVSHGHRKGGESRIDMEGRLAVALIRRL
jgi:hypothetical protein